MVKKCPSCGYNNRDDAHSAQAVAPHSQARPQRSNQSLQSRSNPSLPRRTNSGSGTGTMLLSSQPTSHLCLQPLWQIHLSRRLESIHGSRTLSSMLRRNCTNGSTTTTTNDASSRTRVRTSLRSPAATHASYGSRAHSYVCPVSTSLRCTISATSTLGIHPRDDRRNTRHP